VKGLEMQQVRPVLVNGERAICHRVGGPRARCWGSGGDSQYAYSCAGQRNTTARPPNASKFQGKAKKVLPTNLIYFLRP
jgi:hypothetical protein